MEDTFGPYRDRMRPFVLVATLYSIGVSFWFLFGEPTTHGLIIASTVALFFGLAIGLDAVFASLLERLPPRG